MILACFLDSGKKLRESKNQILDNYTENFGTVHYQLGCPSQFQKLPYQKMCVVSTRVVLYNIYLICEWSRLPEIYNKFSYGFFRPKHVGTLTTLFKVNTQVIHRFTLGTYLLNTYEVRNMFKGPIMLFTVLFALLSKKTYINRFVSLLGFNGAT